MLAANFTEFRTELKNYLDKVEDNNETLIIKRKTGKGTVVISLDEYNSCLLYTSPSPRDGLLSRMPSSA